MIIDFLFLIPLFIVGGICCFTDIRYGKIKNKWILFGLMWAILLYLGLFLYNLFYLCEPENDRYLLNLLLNGGIAFLVGYGIWYFNLWSAGDAKLFTLYALLLPLKFYSKSYLPYFPSFCLLVNTFFPLLILLVIQGSVIGIKEILKIKKTKINFSSLKKLFIEIKPKVKKIAGTFVGFISIFIILHLARAQVSQQLSSVISNPVLIFFVIFFSYRVIFRILGKKKKVVLGLGIGSLIYSGYLVSTSQLGVLFNILKTALFFMVIINLLRQILDFYIEKKETRKIKLKELRPQMILAQTTLKELLKKMQLKTKKEIEAKIGSFFSEGLTEDQVNFIKKLWFKEPEKKLKIYRTFPFSPFLFLGFIITLVTQNSILSIILAIFH